MKKRIIVITSLVIVTLIGLAAAGGAHWFGHKSPEDRINYMKFKLKEALVLTEDQSVALDQMAEDVLAEHEQMRVRREAFRERFIDVLSQDSVTQEDLASLFDEKKPDIDHLMQLAAAHIAEFHSLLSPEQRTLLITKIENHHQRCRFGKWSSQSDGPEGRSN